MQNHGPQAFLPPLRTNWCSDATLYNATMAIKSILIQKGLLGSPAQQKPQKLPWKGQCHALTPAILYVAIDNSQPEKKKNKNQRAFNCSTGVAPENTSR